MNTKYQRKDLFDFMLSKIKQTAAKHGDALPQAFGRWFIQMYFSGIKDIYITDGTRDGKVDLFATCQKGHNIQYHIVNSKFTEKYDNPSPVSFYDEITRFWQAFENKNNRHNYLKNIVRPDYVNHYKRLFKLYDQGNADLYFITNHKINTRQYETVKDYGIKILHLDDVIQYLMEHIEGAMPETDPLILSGITTVLTPPENESEVPTSIVFARLIDFLKYMEDDQFELLFARNVRLWLGNTETNKQITDTFEKNPKEFAFSNNGITILCRKHSYDPGKKELRLENPRIVNGSQTLHSIKDVDNPSTSARVMVKIIEVPSIGQCDISSQAEKRRDIIHKISIRSNSQNPIKRWNLVSNDDFQNELHKYFWSKGYYYERRQNEWNYRRIELRSLGLKRGIDIREMTQLISSYLYNRSMFGPAIAQGQLNVLFDEDRYDTIRATKYELAFNLSLLGKLAWEALSSLKNEREYIDAVANYIYFCVVSILCVAINDSNINIQSEDSATLLIQMLQSNTPPLKSAIKNIVDYLLTYYEAKKNRLYESERKELSYANYFKNSAYVSEILINKLPEKLKKIIVAAFR
jgi:AIPR protein